MIFLYCRLLFEYYNKRLNIITSSIETTTDTYLWVIDTYKKFNQKFDNADEEATTKALTIFKIVELKC